MPLFTVSDILNITGARLHFGDPSVEISGVQTDSRRVGQGDMFVAIKGERVDGHDYISRAFDHGALCALAQKSNQDIDSRRESGKCLVLSSDPVAALGDLSKWYRDKHNPVVIGITGSLGKTTTKDMIRSVLSVRFRALANEGNLNTEIGVPLTLFRLRQEHEVAVIEMGMRGLGQISYLAGLARPKIGVLTNIGESHLEVLGSVENIARAKAELLQSLPSDGVAVLNRDNPWVQTVSETFGGRKMWYSTSQDAEITAMDIESLGNQGMTFTLATPVGLTRVTIPLPGYHNVSNALAAAGVGVAMGMTIDEIARGMSNIRVSGMRTEVLQIAGFRLINDAYNASPASTRAALAVQRDIARGQRTVAVLGDMLELGTYSRLGHAEVGESVVKHQIDVLITVGELARGIASAAREHGHPHVVETGDNDEAVNALLAIVRDGDTVLVKGSRGMQMERVVRAVKAHFGVEEPEDASH